jgi:hypothetical protein
MAIRNRLYYSIKPWVPLSVRVAVRRWFSRRQLRRFESSWPIMPGSEAPPPGWPGWPEGKQFAFVLTHDVEGPSGLAKCRALMELERQVGVRSSYNLTPEGSYTVARELREELTRKGFEVGVHDLHHDGKLFQEKAQFSRNAQRINHYLKDWGARGFRAGFMLHNLDWLHELNIQYDASTFDTDPFEPQPHGRNTIFPFWVPRPAAAGLGASHHAPDQGYMELPYTLVQDSTLFLLLGERTTDVWKRKLEWVARHGGMALLIVHPDYMSFDPRAREPYTFPAELYREFLEWVERTFRQQYWQALPREVAHYCVAARSADVVLARGAPVSRD